MYDRTCLYWQGRMYVKRPMPEWTPHTYVVFVFPYRDSMYPHANMQVTSWYLGKRT